MTWLLALLAIELALTHHAVWKVHPSASLLINIAVTVGMLLTSMTGHSFSFCCMAR